MFFRLRRNQMKNVSAFVVLGAFIISVVLTGCADLDNALSSLKVDQQKDSLTEDIDRAKTVKKLSYLTDSASRTLRSSEQGDADTIATAKAHADAVGETIFLYQPIPRQCTIGTR